MRVEARLETDKKKSSILKGGFVFLSFFFFAFGFVNPLPSREQRDSSTWRNWKEGKMWSKEHAWSVLVLSCSIATILKNPIKGKTQEAEVAASVESKRCGVFFPPKRKTC